MADPFHIVGTSLEGKYRIDEVVGEGGFGVVYRGYHLSFEQPIAIKCLKVPAHFTPDARELFLAKFREEGKHLARLGEHPSITRVYDFGIVDGPTPVPYLVLEWLDGEDLEQLLARRRKNGERYSASEALQLLRPAIDALSLAHGLGIAHRDIKPPNLYWARGARGRVLKVLDFGIAKAMAEGDTATQIATKTSSGFSAFSPSYGAPEQFRSKKYGATGPWTDVHAIGLILSEMLAGRAPFEGDEMIEFYEQCSKEARPTARALGAEVSDEFEALQQKALALSPKARFATAGELLEAVDQLLDAAEPEALGGAAPKAKTRRTSAARTVAAGPLGTQMASSATVLAEPLEVASTPKAQKAGGIAPARLALGAAALAVLVGGVVYMSRGSTTEPSASAPNASMARTASSPSSATPVPTAAPAPSSAQAVDSAEPPTALGAYVPLSSSTPRLGPERARVTIVEFADYQCRFCAQAAGPLKDLVAAYPGQVSLHVLNLPLGGMHPDAEQAARAVQAARRQGKAFELADKLFANQKALSAADLDRYAAAVGLDVDKFKRDLASQEIKDEVARDVETARSAGVSGTPTIFVNGRPYVGERSVDGFRPVIEQELAAAEALLKGGTPLAKVYETRARANAAPASPTGPGLAQSARAIPMGTGRAPDAPRPAGGGDDFDGLLKESGVSSAADADGDGIPDSKDQCPHVKETKNLVNDQDGCPD